MLTVVGFFVMVGLGIWMGQRGSRRARGYLDQWAEREGLRLVSRPTYVARPYPWFWRSREQRLYAIEVEDANGQRRSGLALVGGWFVGTWRDQVKVRWKDEQG